MDREAGYQQARLDMLRGDNFAAVNHQHKVLDWNVDPLAWTEGYAEFLDETSRDTTNPEKATLALDLLDRATAPPRTRQ